MQIHNHSAIRAHFAEVARDLEAYATDAPAEYRRGITEVIAYSTRGPLEDIEDAKVDVEQMLQGHTPTEGRRYASESWMLAEEARRQASVLRSKIDGDMLRDVEYTRDLLIAPHRGADQGFDPEHVQRFIESVQRLLDATKAARVNADLTATVARIAYERDAFHA